MIIKLFCLEGKLEDKCCIFRFNFILMYSQFNVFTIYFYILSLYIFLFYFINFFITFSAILNFS